MARDVTVTFADGAQHIYKGAPDSVTFEQALAQAQKDFPDADIRHIDGGYRAEAKAAPADTGYSAKDYASAVTAGAAKVLPTAVKGLADLGSMVTGGEYGGDLSQTMTDVMKSSDEYWHTAKVAEQSKKFEHLIQNDDKGVGDLFGFMVDNIPLVLDQGVATIGSMFLPVGAAGAVAKGAKIAQLSAKTAQKALTATTIGTTAAQNAADTFNSDALKGMSLEDRYKAASISAAGTILMGIATKGGAEGAVARRLAGELQEGKVGLGTVKEFLKKAGTAMGKEGIQETGEEASGALGEAYAGADLTPTGVGKRLALAGTLGALVGGGAEVVTPGAKRAETPEGETEPLVTPTVAPAAEVVPGITEEQAAQVDAATAKAIRLGIDPELARQSELRRLGLTATPTEPSTTAEVPPSEEVAAPEVAGEPTDLRPRTSAEVSGTAAELAAPGGVEDAERFGVVRAGAPAGKVSRAEGEQPTALTDVVPKEGATALYKTAKGSIYHAYPDGSTTRIKSYHPEHGPEDVGEKERSTKTVYISRESLGLNPVGIDWGGQKWRMVDHGDNTLSLVSQRSDGRWGRDEFGANVPYSTEPAVGLTPVELWKPAKPDDSIRRVNTVKEAYRGVHFGNKITEVLPVAPKAAPAEVTAPTAELSDADLFARMKDFAAKDEIKPVQSYAEMRNAPVETIEAVDTTSAAKHFNPQEISKLEVPRRGSRERLIEMPIDDFLGLANELKTKTSGAADKVLKEGRTYEDLPFLNIKDDGQVAGHEGRHRALALKNAGYKTMPVVLRTENIRWDKQNNPNDFDYVAEWPTELKAQKQAKDPQFAVPFPVSRENATAPYAQLLASVASKQQAQDKALATAGESAPTETDIRAQQGEATDEGPDLFPQIKDFDSAVKAIVKNAPNPAYARIARAVAMRVEELKDLGFQFSLSVTPEGKMLSSGASGTSVISYAGLGEHTSVNITLNHPSNGKLSGTDWKTVTHELVHAVTQAQIRYAPDGTAAHKLKDLHKDLVKHLNARFTEGNLTPYEERIYRRHTNALLDPDELLAWGLTDRETQEYLNSIPSKRGTFLSRLFDAIANALGFGKADSALAELLSVSTDILSEPLSPYVHEAMQHGRSFGKQENKTPHPTWLLQAAEGKPIAWSDKDAALISATSIMGKPIHLLATPKGTSRVDVGNYTGNMLPAQRLKEIQDIAKGLTETRESRTQRQQVSDLAKDVTREADRMKKDADDIDARIEHSIDAFRKSKDIEGLRDQVKISTRLRNRKQNVEAVRDIANASNNKALGALVVAMPTELLIDMATQHEALSELNRTRDLVDRMDGRRVQMLEGGAKEWNEIRTLVGDDLDAYNEMVLTSTSAQVDPRDATADNKLTQAYKKLPKRIQEAVSRTFDYYDAMVDYAHQILTSNVEAMASSPVERDRMLKRIDEYLGSNNRIHPYAPLTRNQEGPYWLGIGKGKDLQFMTFSDLKERDAVAREMAKSYGKSVEQLMEDQEFNVGNELSALRKAMVARPGSLLRDIFEMLDNSETNQEGMKDAIFQMWVQLQPEQSFAKQFAQRRKLSPAGYNTDVLNNLNKSILQFSTQLPRMQYSPQIRQSVEQARAAIENQPKLTPYVSEVDKRVEAMLNPQSKTGFDKAVTLANAGAFSYYMSISTGMLQAVGAFQMGVPQLLKHHSLSDVTGELMRTMGAFSTTGVRTKNGGWKMPTISDAEFMRSKPTDTAEQSARKAEDRMFIQAMRDRNVVEATMARDIFNFQDIPTEMLDTTGQKLKQAADFVVGGLIHHTERLSREYIYLASARLWRNKMLTAFRKSDAYKAAKTADERTALEHKFITAKIDTIASKATKDVNDSLFNYSKFGKPRYMQHPVGRLALQFFTYNLNAFGFMMRNLKGMMAPWKGETRIGCMKAFMGTMFTTYLTSGVTGLFGFKIILGMMIRMFDDDKDKPAELQNMSSIMWFKDHWLPETISSIPVFGKELGTQVAKIVSDGPLNWATGVDIAARTGLADLGTLRETRDVRSTRGQALEFVVQQAGPAASMLLAQTEGMADIMDGNYYKGVEKIMPAALRHPMQAYRYFEDGETTKDGKTVLKPSGFTVGNILFKMVGFSPVTLADIKKATAEATKAEQKVINEKTDILDKLAMEYFAGNAKGYDAQLARMQKYNNRYSLVMPDLAITGEMVFNRLQKRGEARLSSSRGFNLKPENYALSAEILKPSRKAAEEAEKRGQ